nr:putative ribonuclease H-like domain-containing protein [Tanacetum cinerariifolium]
VQSSEKIVSETENKSENDCQEIEKVWDRKETSNMIAPEMFKISVSQSVSPISITKTSCSSNSVENLDTLSSVRRPKSNGVMWMKKGLSNTVKLIYLMNALCNAIMNATVDVNDLFVFDDVSIRKSHDSKMPFRKKPLDSLNKTQVNLQLQVQCVRIDNGTEFKNKTLAKFFDEVGITQQFSAARTPQQNGVVETRNQTLVEAARTMLTFANLPLFLWAKAIATTCFTQNCSFINKHFDKTPYELMNKRKPDIKFFRVFGYRCYLLSDYEDVGKLKAKGDIGLFVGYLKEYDAFRIYNKRTQPDLSNLNETRKSSNQSVSQVSETSKKYLEDLFQKFYDEYFDSSKIMISSTTDVETSNVEVPSHEEEVLHESSESFQEESSSSSLNDDVHQSLEEIMKSSTTDVETSNVEVPSHEEEVLHESSESFQEESSSSSLNDDVHQSLEEVAVPLSNTQSISNNMIPNVD